MMDRSPMLSSSDLVEMAESFTLRIPNSPEYAEEREASWKHVGHGHLACGDVNGALRAVGRLPVGRPHAHLLFAIAKWAGEHPESDAGRKVVREIVDQMAVWETWFHRREISKLGPIVYRMLGEAALRKFVDDLEDPFSKAGMLADCAVGTDDVTKRRDLMTEAEHVASAVPGDRDWVLRRMLRAYQRLGWESDAERVKSMMESDPALMDAPIHQANQLLSNPLLKPEKEVPDLPAAQLARFLIYRYNDLKVFWLIGQARCGGLDDPHVETQVSGKQFQQLEPARQLAIHSDPSLLAPTEFAAFFFSRPIVEDVDRELFEVELGSFHTSDALALTEAVSQLMSTFADSTRRYSADQIEQGLWFLFGYPYFFFEELASSAVPLEVRIACLRAMVHPFRDYYQKTANFEGSAFFMWWDHFRDWKSHAKILPVYREVLSEILTFSNRRCQTAALHGLNHLHPDEDAAAIIDFYLEQNRQTMTPEDIAYAEACQLGKAL